MNSTRTLILFSLLAVPAAGQTFTGVSPSTGPVTLGYTKPAPKAAPKKPAAPAAKKAAPAKVKKPAAKPAPRKVQAGACEADAKKFCATESKKGRQALHDCLLGHLKELSGRCRSFSSGKVDAACRTELGLLCGGAEAGSEAGEACLRAHLDDETTACRNALDDESAKK
jgi:hypothetical protein